MRGRGVILAHMKKREPAAYAGEPAWPGGALIREKREALDISIREAARLAGISDRTWGYAEQGRPGEIPGVLYWAKPTDRTLKRIEIVLDLPPNRLIHMKKEFETNRAPLVTDGAVGTVISMGASKIGASELAALVSADGLDSEERTGLILGLTKHLTHPERAAVIAALAGQSTEDRQQ